MKHAHLVLASIALGLLLCSALAGRAPAGSVRPAQQTPQLTRSAPQAPETAAPGPHGLRSMAGGAAPTPWAEVLPSYAELEPDEAQQLRNEQDGPCEDEPRAEIEPAPREALSVREPVDDPFEKPKQDGLGPTPAEGAAEIPEPSAELLAAQAEYLQRARALEQQLTGDELAAEKARTKRATLGGL